MTIKRSATAKSRQTGRKSSKPKPASRSRMCRAPHLGQKCSQCGKGRLDYDGLLQLHCPACGFIASSGGFT